MFRKDVETYSSSIINTWSSFLFQVTYRALEQLNESGFDLIKVENVVRRQTRQSQNLESLLVSTSSPTPETQPLKSQTESSNKENSSKGHQRLFQTSVNLSYSGSKSKRACVVSPKEIAKDQGKPISKYERNMMIFDWLHTLGMMLNFSIEFIK